MATWKAQAAFNLQQSHYSALGFTINLLRNRAYSVVTLLELNQDTLIIYIN